MTSALAFEKFKLSSGKHANFEDGACIMEMVSYFADEPWSDHPQCACEVLTSYGIRLNDRLDDETRQKLKPLIPLLIGTRADRPTRVLRSKFIVHRMLTVSFPIFTDALGLEEISARLRKTTNDEKSFRDIAAFLREKRAEIRQAAADADAAADAADAAYAADAAASDADAYAYAAAAYAAADAAAAYAAAAYAAAYPDDAASPAKKAKWQAVKDECNESAIETLRLACAIGKKE